MTQSDAYAKALDYLSPKERELLDSCIAWHIRPHRRAFVEGLAAISPELRFDGSRVLEIGAIALSSLAPFLVGRGAEATVTCYCADELPKLEKALSSLARSYGLDGSRLSAERADVFDLDQQRKYDLVVLKGTLGGVNREHDSVSFRKAVSCCLDVLNPGGALLVVDKGHSTALNYLLLSRWGGGGRNGYHYFTFSEIRDLIPPGWYEAHLTAYGVLSFGDFGGGVVQRVADFLDERVVEKLVAPEKRCVFSLVCKRVGG